MIWHCTSKSRGAPLFWQNCPFFGPLFLEYCPFMKCGSYATLQYIIRPAKLLHCKLHTAHCTLHTAHCTLHTAHCTLHTAHCTLHTAHSHPIPCTQHMLRQLSPCMLYFEVLSSETKEQNTQHNTINLVVLYNPLLKFNLVQFLIKFSRYKIVLFMNIYLYLCWSITNSFERFHL